VARERLTVRVHNFDPTLAPPGKTLLTVMIPSRFDYWEKLRQDMNAYKAEKERVADAVTFALGRRFIGLGSQIEMRDVATPVTYHRYTGNWQGSFEGWMITPRTLTLRMSKTLPGLDRFYMCGQWVEPGGGLPTAAKSGRDVIQILCKRDKREFVTAVPS
jgi:phytoene dehydrogenase-like protein